MEADVMALFHELAGRSPSERDAYFASREIPSAVRAEVESLLRFDGASGPSFGPYVAAAASGVLRATDDVQAAARYGSYRLIQLLGRGGMGAVYEAEQDRPRRRVALKIIRPGLASPELVRRFEQESQALGRLHHPGIAQIYEAGTADVGAGPQPYFAMELVRGAPLLDYAESRKLTAAQRLQLVARICEAVDHAHQRGIIHRDLKPGNILVDETGQPKILDFGVARVTDSDVQSTRQTDVGQLIGTLAYMSPEQVLADPLELDMRTDVYSLGVILYELLSNRLPYNTNGKLHEVARTIREDDPAPLSTINRAYRGDIETIVFKALEKDVTRRYGSAAALAADIQRYLHDEPIVARPASTIYQLQKFARRHRTLVSAIAAVFVVLVAGVVVSTWQAIEARRARDTADAQRARAVRQLARASGLNEFLQLMLSEGTSRDKPLSVLEMLERGESMLDKAYAADTGLRSEILIVLAGEYNLFGDSDRALRAADKAMALARDLPDRSIRASAACKRAVAVSATRPDEGLRLIDDALASLTAGDDLATRRIECLLAKSTVSSNQERTAEAVASAEEASVLAREGDFISRTLQIDTLDRLAWAYSTARQLAKADAIYRQLVDLLGQFGQQETTVASMVLNNWGGNRFRSGDMVAAADLYGRSIDLERRLDSSRPIDATRLVNLANTKINLARYDEARRLLDAALQSLERNQNRRLLGSAYISLTVIELAQGDLARAERAIRTADEILRTLVPETHSFRLTVRFLSLELLRRRGRASEALERLGPLLADLEPLGATGVRVRTLIEGARVQMALHYPDAAVLMADSALDVAHKLTPDLRHSMFIGLAERAVGEVALSRKRFDEARRSLSAARESLVSSLGPAHPSVTEVTQLLLQLQQ